MITVICVVEQLSISDRRDLGSITSVQTVFLHQVMLDIKCDALRGVKSNGSKEKDKDEHIHINENITFFNS